MKKEREVERKKERPTRLPQQREVLCSRSRVRTPDVCLHSSVSLMHDFLHWTKGWSVCMCVCLGWVGGGGGSGYLQHDFPFSASLFLDFRMH